MGYVEMIGALSAARQDAARLELLLGWHPEREDWMTEEEDRAWEDLHYVSASALEDEDVSGPWIDALALWGRYFPELQENRDRPITVQELWGVTLERVEVLRLADELGLRLSVRHFPPGTSKWNKIKHRMFCHITENWRGRPLISRLAVVELIAATRTAQGAYSAEVALPFRRKWPRRCDRSGPGVPGQEARASERSDAGGVTTPWRSGVDRCRACFDAWILLSV